MLTNNNPYPELTHQPGTVEPSARRRDSRTLSLNRTLTTTSTNHPKINIQGLGAAPLTAANDQG